MRIEDKLTILADAAKYDVSCASSGSRRSNAGGRLGNAAPSGICHTYTEDGRCVSLLKILFTNHCIFDCAYCVNRTGNDLPRAAFTPREVADLTLDFYRHNYIEGLFLSSGILRSPDETMERLVRTVSELRMRGFNGYIHLKCVPFASGRLIRQAGLYADRLSVNIELPSEESLRRLTRDKTYDAVLKPMDVIREGIAEAREDRKRLRHAPAFVPAGQSTQLIIGASPETDFQILNLADRFYRRRSLRRVYYAAYVPVEKPAGSLPNIAKPPLRRENRLYQADWLIRLYGFSVDEVISRETPHLDLEIDPKQAFALRHPESFPVDVNTADRAMILRVPGIGLKSAHRIVSLRRKGRIRFEHLKRMGVVLSRATPFILCDGQPVVQWSGAEPGHGIAPVRSRGTSDSAAVRNERVVFETDGTFDGLLTAILDAYTATPPPEAVESVENRQQELFDRRARIVTDPAKTERVWNGLKERLGSKRRRMLFEAFLSGHPGVETAIYRFVHDTVPGRGGRRNEAHLASQLLVESLAGKVRREAHRFKGFTRFERIDEEKYLALIEPRYDVLPLIRRHFESRFADQPWIIYDQRRNYGLCYDRRVTRELKLDVAALKATCEDPGEKERFSQALWRRYYAAVNIEQRNNPGLHLRQLPRRFWRFLTEKQPK